MSREQLADLLNQALPCAEEMLQKHRCFHPYGAVMDREQTVILVGADLRGDIPPAEELVETLVGILRGHAHEGHCLATALVVDVRVRPPGASEETDAVMVSLEHADGSLVDVFVPYSLPGESEVRYGELFAAGGEGRVFDAGNDERSGGPRL